MAFKKHSRGDGLSGSGIPERNTQKRSTFNLIGHRFNRMSQSELERFFEPWLRKLVREEVEGAMSKLLGPSPWSGSPSNPTGTFGLPGLKLRFINDLSKTLFTGSSIKATDESPVAIELIDSKTGIRVTTGFLSSAKVSILVIDGEYDPDNGEDKNQGEFKSRIVREREGRRPLITGDLTAKLQGGVAFLGNIMFTDNSSWIRSRKFRLGAQISEKFPTDVRVKEALSRSFVVKDHRGEGYQKHYPPSLEDEIWRLDKIAKDRVFHKRLATQGIHKVEDFLRLLETNPSGLRAIIKEGQGIQKGIWDAIVAHARTCIVDDGDQAFIYLHESTSARLILNWVYKVVSVSFDGETYIPVDRLTPPQLALMQNLKRQAHANIDRLIPVGEAFGESQQATVAPPLETFLIPQGYSPMTSGPMLYGHEFTGTLQPEASGPYNDVCPDQNFASTTMVENILKGDIPSEVYNGGFGFASSSQGPAMLDSKNIIPTGISTYFPSSHSVPDDSCFFMPPSVVAEEGGTFNNASDFASVTEPSDVQCPSLDVHIYGRKVGPKVAWSKVRAAFKFRSMRKMIARKRHTSGSPIRSMRCF